MPWNYPVFLNLEGKRCLLIGGGHESAEKLEDLVAAGAKVTWLAAEGPVEAREMASAGLVGWIRRDYAPGDLDGYFLVVAANDDRSRNVPIFEEAERRNVLINCLDDPPRCRFAFASTLRRGSLVVAFFTNGRSPALGVRLRQRFERELGPEYERFLDLCGEFREEIAAKVPAFSDRRDLWYRVVDSDALALLKDGREDAARGVFRQLIDEAVAPPAAAVTRG